MASDPVIHVIDDDDAARQSLAFLLQSAQFAACAHNSARTFLDAMSAIVPGCIITDVRMPEIDGIELLRRLKSLKIGWPVIVITGHADVPLAIEAMKQGAVDFIEKPYNGDALLGAVRAALSLYKQNAARDAEKIEILDRVTALSPRERQVLDGLVAGHLNKIIAYNLGISDRTVEVYRAKVMTKMQAKSLSHLVRMTLIADL
jgi:two-component system response regulator FixJ